MMDTVRSWMSGISVVLLAVGYAASQRAFVGGTGAAYAERLANPALVALSLVWLALAVAAALLPDGGGEPR